MPFYSVRIDGGKDKAAAGREAREAFRGRAADYTGAPNFFYVEGNYSGEQLKQNVEGSLGGNYNVIVQEIDEEEYNWRG